MNKILISGLVFLMELQTVQAKAETADEVYLRKLLLENNYSCIATEYQLPTDSNYNNNDGLGNFEVTCLDPERELIIQIQSGYPSTLRKVSITDKKTFLGTGVEGRRSVESLLNESLLRLNRGY